ncbi:MAG: molybdopterin oxidoreductase [Chloroflexi bacterium]|nr:MAG: molybdopterin oxidoreductase [Chloroflexota bacterium]
MSEITRREFLKAGAFLGGTAVLSTSVNKVFDQLRARPDGLGLLQDSEYVNNLPENIIYSTCLNCHTACTIKGKIRDGVLIKIDGNPYSATNRLPNLNYDMDPKEAAHYEGKVCPKGQAGVPVLYDPYRIRKVLKRAGKRGENKWVTIEWDQFIDEVVNGGNLFGEGHVPGLKELWKLRDPELAKELKADAAAVASGEMTVAEFKEKHADHLDVLIDPDHPDFGPINNQFVFLGGRVEHGRKEFCKRWIYDGFGSTNFFLHTTICEQSHHIAFKMASGKTHMKPDLLNAEYVIFFGTGAFEANFGPPAIAEKVTDSLVNRKNFQMVVVDPRLSKTAAHADRWVPVRPGKDGALALAMIRWIIENERYDKRYLENPNKEAANADGEPTWTDATWLVRTDEMVFLRAEDVGIEISDGQMPYLVMTDEGVSLAETAVSGKLEGEFTLNNIPVKPVFQLLKERSFEYTLEEYAEITGVDQRVIIEMADNFTSHGKKAAAEFYRGPVQHTNGYYNAQAIIALNTLIGNCDWKGGMTVGGGHWHEDGSHGGKFTPDQVISAPNGLPHFGIYLSRERIAYEKTTLFQENGYPAKRMWYPFSDEVYQEVIPSAAEGYPYNIKAMLIHKGTPALAIPAGDKQIPMLMDTEKIPLLLACDIVIGETTMYADYVIPDLTYMERWGTSHVSPDVLVKVSKVRQPMVAPIPETVVVDGEEMPICLETFFIAVGKKLGLPGIGKDGFGPGLNFDRPEDYFLKLIANIAWGDHEDGSDAVPEASDEELELFRKARRHLPAAVFDEEKWKRALGNDESLWRRVVYVLNRGGRFAPLRDSYEGDYLKKKFGGMFHLYVEPVAKARNPFTGERYDGLPRYEMPKNSLGEVAYDEEYPLHLITFKEITGGQSRTIASYWLSSILPENPVLMNRRDAEKLGVKDGDLVRITSKDNPDGVWNLGHGMVRPVEGHVKVIEGIRPGVVAVSWHYGHWAYGANDVVVDGQVIPGDPRRGTGLCTNAVLRVDDATGNTCLSDPIGGSTSFYDTRVRVERVD